MYLFMNIHKKPQDNKGKKKTNQEFLDQKFIFLALFLFTILPSFSSHFHLRQMMKTSPASR